MTTAKQKRIKAKQKQTKKRRKTGTKVAESKPSTHPAVLAAGANMPSANGPQKPQEKSEAADSKEQPAPEEALATALLEMPIHLCRSGFATNVLDMRITVRQAAALKVLWCSLSETGARYTGSGGNHPDGKVVDCPTHAVRWLLDRLGDGIEETTGKNLTTDFDLVFK